MKNLREYLQDLFEGVNKTQKDGLGVTLDKEDLGKKPGSKPSKRSRSVKIKPLKKQKDGLGKVINEK